MGANRLLNMKLATAEIIMLKDLQCGWQVEEFVEGYLLVRLINLVAPMWNHRFMCAIFMPQSFISWGLIPIVSVTFSMGLMKS